jgi:hypothetical protein
MNTPEAPETTGTAVDAAGTATADLSAATSKNICHSTRISSLGGAHNGDGPRRLHSPPPPPAIIGTGVRPHTQNHGVPMPPLGRICRRPLLRARDCLPSSPLPPTVLVNNHAQFSPRHRLARAIKRVHDYYNCTCVYVRAFARDLAVGWSRNYIVITNFRNYA